MNLVVGGSRNYGRVGGGFGEDPPVGNKLIAYRLCVECIEIQHLIDLNVAQTFHLMILAGTIWFSCTSRDSRIQSLSKIAL